MLYQVCDAPCEAIIFASARLLQGFRSPLRAGRMFKQPHHYHPGTSSNLAVMENVFLSNQLLHNHIHCFVCLSFAKRPLCQYQVTCHHQSVYLFN